MTLFKRKSQFDDDLGFGNQPVSGNQRLMNTDGTSNWLISMSWKKFLFILLSAYLAVNVFFATLYVYT